MADFPRRGQIYWVDFNPTKGSEQAGRRPALIVSNDVANQHGSTVTVVPITRTIPPKNYPQNVALPAAQPLPDAGTILCGQVRTITKQRLDGCRATLEAAQMDAVNAALLSALGLPRAPGS